MDNKTPRRYEEDRVAGARRALGKAAQKGSWKIIEVRPKAPTHPGFYDPPAENIMLLTDTGQGDCLAERKQRRGNGAGDGGYGTLPASVATCVVEDWALPTQKNY